MAVSRYAPGGRELGIAGDCARYVRAFQHVNDTGQMGWDEETIIALASTAFFNDLSASTEIQQKVNMHNMMVEAEMEAEAEFMANSQPEDKDESDPNPDPDTDPKRRFFKKGN